MLTILLLACTAKEAVVDGTETGLQADADTDADSDTDTDTDTDTGPGEVWHDFRFTMSNYTPYEGLPARVHVRNAAGDVRFDSVADVADGGFTLFQASALRDGESHTVDWYVDKNDNAACDSADGRWTVALGPATGPESIEHSFADEHALDDAACEPFPKPELYDIRVYGEGYDAHVDQLLALNIVRLDTNTVIANHSYVLSDASFEMSWSQVLPVEAELAVHWFGDFDEDGVCSDEDHVWILDIGSFDDHADITLDHPDPFTIDLAGCEHF